MSTVKKITTPACCGKTQVVLELSFPLITDHLNIFLQKGFITNTSYNKAGIFYVENNGLIAICPFGSNRLQIKCKNSQCEEYLNLFEIIISNIQ